LELKNSSRYLYYVAWSIGAVLLVYYSSYLYDYANDWRARFLNIRGYSLWIPVLLSLIFGFYLAFINGMPKQPRVNASRVIVFFITFILLAYFILLFYYDLPKFSNLQYLRFMSQNGQFYFGVICGYSLLTSVFRFGNQE
jgi:hypothetical protein